MTTVSQLRSQWSNPGDVLSLLLIIGGDIVQKALAQSTAGRVPHVCFSFGWVAYSFTTLVGVIGDGKLLPPPDYPVKVFNLETGYVRENKNWILGRILRDNEVFMSKRGELNGAAFRISVYKAVDRSTKRRPFTSEIIWMTITSIQLGVAAIPLGLDREWGVFLITFSGIIAAIVAGGLPQWSIEKLPLRRSSSKYIALTSGNGSREVMIIYGDGVALDLEELAAGESPRSDRIWEASSLFSARVKGRMGETHKSGNEYRRAFMYDGLPVGLWMTRIACFCLTIFWVVLLITVAGIRSHSWYLVLVGSLGMLQNAILAAVARSPDRRGLPLTLVDTIIAQRTMDGLMDLEMTITGAGRVLLDEFFPGTLLNEDEIAWWSGDRDTYDDKRMKRDRNRQSEMRRGRPRSRMPRKNIDIPDIDYTGKLRFFRRTSSWESYLSGDTEMLRLSPPPITRDYEPRSSFTVKRPDVTADIMSESPGRELLPRNDPPQARRKRSEDSVRSPDWA
jgi:hypothetical protein